MCRSLSSSLCIWRDSNTCGERERGREGGRERERGGREGGREGERERERERGREKKREREHNIQLSMAALHNSKY